MNTQFKRVAYLAPELPSLSATFVSNEIWALEDMGVEIHPYSVHSPNAKAHGERAADLEARTQIIYGQDFSQALKALGWNLLHHKRSSLRAFGYLARDLMKVGIFRQQSLKLVYQFLRGAWLARSMRGQNIEHLHIHFAHVPTQIGMYAATLAGIPFTFMSHANDIFERPLLLKEKIQRAKKAVTISNFNIELMTNHGGDPTQMSIVRCGVHPTELQRSDSSMDPRKPLIIGTLGRLVEKKGVDTLILAANVLKQKQIPFQIQIAGDGPLTEELTSLVQEQGLDDLVIFLGALPHAKALSWMQGLDTFVLAGKKDAQGDMDGIPVVLMEAINFGIPVLSTSLSGIPELVIHEKTGLLSQPGHAVDLASNIERLFSDPELKKALTTRAKAHLIAEFDQNLNATRLNNVINA